ncbi:MAG: type II toxin-antitoxin system VapC family toxin [Thermoleophilia bacterium]|nr:type II toxin-antitoxin system VapC family toxin [Thermoleophilia bacterium]
MADDRFVIDANVLIELASRDLLAEFAERMAAPPFVRVETRSALHTDGVRTDTRACAREIQARIERASVELLVDARQGDAAWGIADELGWTKTYDAEYLAAARVHRLPIATNDKRVQRAAAKLGIPLVTLP